MVYDSLYDSIDDRTQAEKNVELKNKKVDYNPHKDDEYGNLKEILKKYKEEIEGIKKDSIVLGEGGLYDATEERERQIIRDHVRANAVCVILYFAVCAISKFIRCLYLKILKQYFRPS
ncbi:U4/U6.U5 tri-snRNP-associated protein 1-like [Dysidea avara]|uniref:U4/U6.U5 tri-snRNP-associated protein 1-like n=1 Tax=Dysidea avara TaxID=196820 RepID=UPI003322FD95